MIFSNLFPDLAKKTRPAVFAAFFCAASVIFVTGALAQTSTAQPNLPAAAAAAISPPAPATATSSATTTTTIQTSGPAAAATPVQATIQTPLPTTTQAPPAPAQPAATTAAPQLPGVPAVNAPDLNSPPSLPGTPAQQQAGPPSVLPAGPQDELSFSSTGVYGTPQKSAAEVQEDVRKEAYDAALQGLLPLRPNEIRELLEHFDKTQESVEVPVYPNPKPEVTVQTVSLDPGAAPVTVKVAHGHVTTLNILDVTGAPWPIEDVSWAGNFEVIESSASQGSHIIRISPGSEFAQGNMSIRLLTLKTPVIISLETSRDIVHYRFDAIIPEYGPNAEAPLIDNGVTMAAGDQTISSVLQGVAPDQSERLDVSGTDGRTTAYRMGSTTYVRTPLTLLSPGWSSSVSSADGMHVYQIEDSPVIILSDNGRMVRARLAAREDLFDEH